MAKTKNVPSVPSGINLDVIRQKAERKAETARLKAEKARIAEAQKAQKAQKDAPLTPEAAQTIERNKARLAEIEAEAARLRAENWALTPNTRGRIPNLVKEMMNQ